MSRSITKTERAEIKQAVAGFMGTKRVCWATPGTENHSSNFYGDTHVCRFTRPKLCEIIECLYVNTFATEDQPALSLAEATDEALGDMQFERPDVD